MRNERFREVRSPGGAAFRRLARRIALASAVTGGTAGWALAQDTSTTAGGAGAARPSPRAVQLVLSGGMTVPTGGFATYHDLGMQASGSVLLRLFGQRLRLRPEVVYNRFDVAEAKVRSLVAQLDRRGAAASAAIPHARALRGSVLPGASLPGASLPGASLPGASPLAADPRLPDLTKLRDGAISSLLGTFANLELPLGPQGFQPYLIGGVGAVAFRTDVTTVGEALDGVQWALNAGAGIRFRLGPIGGGLEARFRQIPVDGARTFFDQVTAVPVSFSLVF